LCASCKGGGYFLAKIGKRGMEDIASRIKDQLPACGEEMERRATGFAHTTADTVANHGFADGTRKRKSAASGVAGMVGAGAKSDEVAGAETGTALIDGSKLGGTNNAPGLWKRQRASF
jgi:hypothetical protein